MCAATPATRLDGVFPGRSGAGPGRGVLMPFVTGGFPSLADTARLLPALADAGAGAIEVGFPFSDPIADGPVIAASMHEALALGCTPERLFETVRSVRASTPASLVAMVSCSIVERLGIERFMDDAARAGFDGVIVPDVDLEDAPRLREACVARSLAFSLLVAPTSPPARVERLVSLCTGFVYVLARLGVTGERADIAADLAARLERLRRLTDLPLAVGFGLAEPAQVARVLDVADGAIVGSAIVRRLADARAEGRDAVAAAAEFVGALAHAARAAAPAPGRTS